MSWKRRFGEIVMLLFLNVAALGGANVRPEDIERLMQMNDTKIVHVIRKKNDEPKEPKLSE